MQPDASKALIYATWGERLLVFDEPDFPEIALQVPGGTMEPGEAALDAAIREFAEETGIEAMTALGVDDYTFTKDGQAICHRRHYFHAVLTGSYPQTWFHTEQSPFDGGPPILFRLFWTTIAEAEARLGLGMGDALGRLSIGQPCR